VANALSFDIATLRSAYLSGSVTPDAVVTEVLARIARSRDRNAWISVFPEARLRAVAAALAKRDPRQLPLYGIPFAVKDNIDVAGLPTTVACPDFAYDPPASAFVVQRLVAAGAIPVGKTNLDQFATGLVGTRSPPPYGVCRNAFDAELISGGSSSGSAVAVALGAVSFALGTDTAGSGRVPAAFNNLVGLKPTRGLLSLRGVVPACRSLDCVSVFALTVDDAESVLRVVAAHDREDAYARANPGENGPSAFGSVPLGFAFGVPRAEDLEFYGNTAWAHAFERVTQEVEALGGNAVAVDLRPMLEAARLLYEGPWVAERYAAIRDFIERSPDALLPVTRAIIEPAGRISAVEAFEAQYRLESLRRDAERQLAGLAFLLLPTAGTIYRIDEVLAEPLRLNANLGRYTNFVNLMDMAAVAVPGGFDPAGRPFGVTLTGPAFSDRRLLSYARALEQSFVLPLGATGLPRPGTGLPAPTDGTAFRIVVCGAHMRGLPLNAELTSRGARLLAVTRTAPRYRLYALPGGRPYRPGLVRDEAQGSAIEVELWELPATEVGRFMAGVPAPLVIGRVELASGTREAGFLCEQQAVAGARELTALGGWRAFLETV
jgi:allophanate hydrolase